MTESIVSSKATEATKTKPVVKVTKTTVVAAKVSISKKATTSKAKAIPAKDTTLTEDTNSKLYKIDRIPVSEAIPACIDNPFNQMYQICENHNDIHMRFTLHGYHHLLLCCFNNISIPNIETATVGGAKTYFCQFNDIPSQRNNFSLSVTFNQDQMTRIIINAPYKSMTLMKSEDKVISKVTNVTAYYFKQQVFDEIYPYFEIVGGLLRDYASGKYYREFKKGGREKVIHAETQLHIHKEIYSLTDMFPESKDLDDYLDVVVDIMHSFVGKNIDIYESKDGSVRQYVFDGNKLTFEHIKLDKGFKKIFSIERGKDKISFTGNKLEINGKAYTSKPMLDASVRLYTRLTDIIESYFF